MANIKYSCTQENLAFLGELDDAFDAYERILESYNYMIKNISGIKTDKKEAYLDVKYYQRLHLYRCAKVLEKYYAEHYTLFTKIKPLWKDVFDNTIEKYFISHQATETNTHSIKYKMPSFKVFLTYLETIFVDCTYSYNIIVYQETEPKEDILRSVNNRLRYSADDARKKRIIREENNIEDTIPELVVFKSLNNISCRKKEHTIKADTVNVPLISNEDLFVKLPVHRCETCGKVFIGNETYKIFNQEYGFIFFKRIIDEGENNRSFNNYALESDLHSFGYNVAEGELSENDRHIILKYLIDNGIMSYFEICRDIENAISIFNGRSNYSAALIKWKCDLKYIGEYVVSNH